MYFAWKCATRSRHIPTNASDVSFSTDFHAFLDGRKRIAPDRAPAPFFALLPAFAGGAHGFPGDAIGLAEVLRGAFPALLMDQVEIVQVRLPARHPLE